MSELDVEGRIERWLGPPRLHKKIHQNPISIETYIKAPAAIVAEMERKTRYWFVSHHGFMPTIVRWVQVGNRGLYEPWEPGQTWSEDATGLVCIAEGVTSA